MKLSALLWGLLGWSSLSFAQSPFEKGRVLKTILVNVDAATYGGDLRAEVDYKFVKLITNNVGLGISFNLNNRTSYESYQPIGHLLPTVRLLKPVADNSLVFGELGVGIGFVETGLELERAFLAKADFGYSYFINRNVAIEPKLTLGYTRYAEVDGSYSFSERSTFYGLGVGLQLYFDPIVWSRKK